ncbi:MAG: guanylate kinase [Candidatus Izemoplasmataceae bacterium]
MLVMIGASASGKTEIAKLLIKNYRFKKMVTYTTRPKREGEIDGVDYHFLSRESFEDKMRIDFFLETSCYNNHYYGTAFKDAALDKVLIVDIQGANALYKELKDDVMIFFIQSPESLRKERMLARGDKLEDVKKRLKIDKDYFVKENLDHIDYIINNAEHDLEEVTYNIYKTYKDTMLV